MNQNLILYNSLHGQTEKICKCIGDELSGENIKYTLVSMDHMPENLDLSAYESVLFGMPVRYGKHDKRMVRFINLHSDRLSRMKTGIFSVNLTARKENKNTPETNPYLKKLLDEISMKPDLVAVMAGALRYTEYGWLDRLMIRLIMKITKGPVDTSANTEFTEWNQVRQFARQYIHMLSS